MHPFRNFSQVTVTLPATDQELATMILGADENPRLVLGLSVFSGTNTAAAMMGLYIIPSQGAASGLEYDLATQNAVKVMQGTQLMDSSTSLGLSQVFVPTIDTRAGGSWLILPPYSLLLIAPQVADLNGTVVVTVSSAELC